MNWSLPLLPLVMLMTCAGISAQELDPDSWRDAYSKRNVRLGITLQEFLDIPFPDPSEYHHTIPSPKCSNDPLADEYISMSFVGDLTGYETIGAIKCGYYGTYTYMVNPYMEQQRLEQISPLLVDWAPDANYYFYQPDNAEPYYLFHITTGGNWPYREVVSAFEQALGQPTHSASVVLQNAFGVNVVSTTSVWGNEVSRIRLVSNNGAIDNHTLDYELSPILSIVKAELERVNRTSRTRL